MSQQSRASVQVVNGEVVLDDPDAVAMFRSVAKHNCRNTFNAQKERVGHFIRRILERGLSDSDVVIVILNVDDANGGALADVLMPGQDWHSMRDRGEVPFARGLAGREGIQDVLGELDLEAAEKLRAMVGRIAVVVVDHGVVEVFAE